MGYHLATEYLKHRFKKLHTSNVTEVFIFITIYINRHKLKDIDRSNTSYLKCL